MTRIVQNMINFAEKPRILQKIAEFSRKRRILQKIPEPSWNSNIWSPSPADLAFYLSLGTTTSPRPYGLCRKNIIQQKIPEFSRKLHNIFCEKLWFFEFEPKLLKISISQVLAHDRGLPMHGSSSPWKMTQNEPRISPRDLVGLELWYFLLNSCCKGDWK